MPGLEIILNKKQENLLPEEKTELRRKVRNLTAAQLEKFSEILSVSDPNMGEEAIQSEVNVLENQ